MITEIHENLAGKYVPAGRVAANEAFEIHDPDCFYDERPTRDFGFNNNNNIRNNPFGATP